jgi:CRISPR-associated Csx3 family protein
MSKHIVSIETIAARLGLAKVETTLPNGKVVMALTWTPGHLPRVFETCNQLREELGVGKNDVVVIDGGCPTWLLPTVSHAFHPTSTAVRFPQGGPDVVLPVSGVQIDGAGAGADVEFEVKEVDEYTLVEFKMTKNEIDAVATLASFVAPVVTFGKAVRISGRGPIAIAAALAEAYAHRVPSVACFQPGTGFVTCISHDAAKPMGTVEK